MPDRRTSESTKLATPLDKTDTVADGPAPLPDHIVNDAAAITTPEGCPNPLGWAEVLAAFHSESTPWRAQVGGDRFAGRTLGKGRPLYFLNGLIGTSDIFCLLVWVLRDEFRCVVLDYPTAIRPLTVENLAAGLLAAADLHGDSTFPLVATSFGGMAALSALREAPARIDRAILQASSAHRQLSAVERMLCRLGRFLPGTVASVPLWNTLARANHQRYFPPFDRSRWGFFIENAGRTPIRDAARRAALLGNFDYRDRLAEIQQPVLLVRSEHEGLVSAGCMEELERRLPNATVEMLHSTGPLAHLTHPHRLAKLVRTFLGGPSAEGALAGLVCLENVR